MYAYTAERLGGGCAKVLMLFYFCYALMNSVLLVAFVWRGCAGVCFAGDVSECADGGGSPGRGVYYFPWSGGTGESQRGAFSRIALSPSFLLVCAAFSTELVSGDWESRVFHADSKTWFANIYCIRRDKGFFYFWVLFKQKGKIRAGRW